MNLEPANLADLVVDLYFSDYARAVSAAGGLPVYLPSHGDPGSFVGHLDGLVLSGGTDIDPVRYGQESRSDMYEPEPARDGFELGILDAISSFEMPVLGICRGIQLINVHAGGTLHQHVESHARFDVPTSRIVHEVTFTEGSVTAALYGRSLWVNSLHHQTIDEVGEGFVVTGRSTDGTVEALEAADRAWLGVQWHPEMMDSRDQDPLFSWLVAESKG